MIISGIPFRLWEKAIRFGIVFFFISTIVSPLFILMLYFFDLNYTCLHGKSTQKISVEKEDFYSNNQQDALETVVKIPAKPYIPIPEITSNITFMDYNYRPDKQVSTAGTILLSTEKASLLTKEHSRIYLNCSDPSTITFSDQKTPFCIIPTSLKDNDLTLTFEVTYENKKNEIIYQSSSKVILHKNSKSDSSLSKEAKAALSILETATFVKEDALLSLMGAKGYEEAKHRPRIHFSGKIPTPFAYVKDKDTFCFEHDTWVKKSTGTIGKPLFVVKSIKNNQIEGMFWNESGFYQKFIKLSPGPTSKSTLSSFTFEKIYKRNNESVIVQINGKTLILKVHDWLSKKDNSWNHVVHLDDFNDIITGKSLKELLIFDKIEREKEKDFFIGYLFDSTREEFRKLQIPLTQKESLVYR